MPAGLRLSHFTAGLMPVLVGYTGSIAIIYAAIEAVGATQAQANSWLLALGVGMGLSGIVMSLAYRMPILTAWSTPGAALLAVSLNGVSINQAVGAFLFCGLLLTLTGLTGWFEKLTRLIPDALASAMLAGILFKFGLGAFVALESDLILVLSMFAAWLAGRLWAPHLAVVFVLIAGVAVCVLTGNYNTDQPLTLALARPEFVMPEFSWSVLIGVGLPLYIVTMTSQNMPGVVVLRASGYEPPISATMTVTGVTTLLLAPFGGYAFNFGAITAALCTGPDADPDPAQRYKAVVVSGAINCVAGLFGATVVSLFLIAPEALILGIAGIALLGTIANSLRAALADDGSREAALITFMTVVSGISFFNIGAPVWGLLLGWAVWHLLARRRAQAA